MKILVIGAGQVGRFLCERLSAEGQEVTLVDQSEEAIAYAQDHINVMGVAGNGASAEVLEQAGIQEADLFIAVTDSDEANILSCLLAREYNVPTRISRTKSIEYSTQGAILSKEKLGIDLMINPRDAVADEIVRISGHSGTFDVAEFVEGKIQFLGYRITANSPICDLSLAELGELRGIYRFVVTAIKRGDQTIVPHGDDCIQDGDSIFIFAHKQDMPAIRYMLEPGTDDKKPDNTKTRRKRVFIMGGGAIGFTVAGELESRQFDIRLLEKDQQRCQELAAKLHRSLVLNAAGDDVETLKDEGIDGADIFIACTEDDQTNILTALLARELGARRTIALVSQPHLISLASSLGVDACVSPRHAAAGAILKYVRRGQIISLAAVEGSNAEVMEIEVQPDSGITNKPLQELHFPRGAIIGAIVHGEQYEIPTGQSKLQSGDRVVIFTMPDAITKVERFFA